MSLTISLFKYFRLFSQKQRFKKVASLKTFFFLSFLTEREVFGNETSVRKDDVRMARRLNYPSL